jgi:Holliday junction resolvase RusA-like endonuclease
VTATLRAIELAEPIVVDIEGRPAPKGSRIAGRTKSGKAYTYPASTYEKGWVAEVKHATQLVMRHRETPPPPYAVTLTFRLNKARRSTYDWPTGADIDKLARAVIDGLVKGGAMSDDRFVCTLTAQKVFTRTDQNPGVIAEVVSEQDIWSSV